MCVVLWICEFMKIFGFKNKILNISSPVFSLKLSWLKVCTDDIFKTKCVFCAHLKLG